MNSLKWKERKEGEKAEREKEGKKGECEIERERRGEHENMERKGKSLKTDVPKLYAYNECEHSVIERVKVFRSTGIQTVLCEFLYFNLRTLGNLNLFALEFFSPSPE